MLNHECLSNVCIHCGKLSPTTAHSADLVKVAEDEGWRKVRSMTYEGKRWACHNCIVRYRKDIESADALAHKNTENNNVEQILKPEIID